MGSSNCNGQNFELIIKEAGKNFVSIEKPDDLQSSANLIRFFSYTGRSLSLLEITQNSFAVNLTASLARLAEQYCCLKKAVFIHWKLKSRTKSVANRPSLFGFSFNSRKTRTFFPASFVMESMNIDGPVLIVK